MPYTTASFDKETAGICKCNLVWPLKRDPSYVLNSSTEICNIWKRFQNMFIGNQPKLIVKFFYSKALWKYLKEISPRYI